MKSVILAGGFGSRIADDVAQKPKPLVEIGGMPILWHIMKVYSFYGIKDFVICCGYKAELIKNYFEEINESWNVILEDTGLNTMTGGRLKRIEKYVGDDTFCFTYGDTVNNVNITELIEFHRKMKKLATVTACQPPEKYGVLELQNDIVSEFKEKPLNTDRWVNGGYFVLEPEVFDYIIDDSTVWEKYPMERLVKEKQLAAFRHAGFYKPMDTVTDRNYLEKLWDSNNAPWKVWK